MNALSETPRITEITLAPGEFYFGCGNTRIHTLLGSCVAITVWHPTKHYGGMCHYLLPIRGQNRRLNRGFFADDAIQLFLDELKKVHTRPQQYVVKLFGGGNMFDYLLKQTNSPNVSEKNISSGLMLLKSHGFTVQASDVGGFGHRKIYLELWNGDVWVQRGNSSGASRD